MKAFSILSGLMLLVTLAACDSGDLAGEWRMVDGARDMKVTLHADSTFLMDSRGFAGEGEYSKLGSGEFVLRPTGALATVMPGGFTGTFRGRSLTLCSPAGICSEFARVQ
jgi:hypothetical protein